MPDYSANPLIKKLGIKPGYVIWLHEAPNHYAGLLGELPEDIEFADLGEPESCDFIHAFFDTEAIFKQDLPTLKSALKMTGGLWVSWPKQSSSLKTDLHRDIIREGGLKTGLVDVKVCAVDKDWSGIKFMYRIKDRK